MFSLKFDVFEYRVGRDEIFIGGVSLYLLGLILALIPELNNTS